MTPALPPRQHRSPALFGHHLLPHWTKSQVLGDWLYLVHQFPRHLVRGLAHGKYMAHFCGMFTWCPCSVLPLLEKHQASNLGISLPSSSPALRMGVCINQQLPGRLPSPQLPLHVSMCSPSLSHTQMGVSFPATFSSHFNSKAKLGRRAASHSQYNLGEKKGDSLVARERRKLGLGWGVVANIPRA